MGQWECHLWLGISLGISQSVDFTKTWRDVAKPKRFHHVTDGLVSIPMTDPWCWYINANMTGVYENGIHVTIFLTAPLGSVMG